MKLFNIRKYLAEGKAVISAELESSYFDGSKTLYFSYPEQYYEYLPESADPFFPAILIPAMLFDPSLEVHGPLSPKLFDNQRVIQDIFLAWHPSKFKKVKVEAKVLQARDPGRICGNATFFSLGVDSMYSMLKYLPRNEPPKGKALTHLIYMKGLELPLSAYSKGQDKGVIEAVQRVGQHYELSTIVGETNIRDIFPLSWEDHYSGPGLAATALSLSGGFKNIFIPSTTSYAIFFLLPSSPLIDNLWSLENTNVYHDGAEKERAGKIADLIAHDEFALSSLRVCVSNDGAGYNCGKCWKCIRTMITLDILGKLKGSGSFPDRLPENFIPELRTYDPMSLEFTRENLRLARQYGRRDLESILGREIRMGSLDVFRQGRSVKEFFKEVMFYCYVKIGKRSGFFQ